LFLANPQTTLLMNLLISLLVRVLDPDGTLNSLLIVDLLLQIVWGRGFKGVLAGEVGKWVGGPSISPRMSQEKPPSPKNFVKMPKLFVIVV